MAKNITKDTDIAIIGLGSFGVNVLNNFYSEGVDVTIIDKNPDLVNQFSSMSSNAIVADTTQLAVLKNIGIQNYDHVIVSIGQDLNASILTTLLLLDCEIENIIVKASDENHAKILKKIGVNHIVYPDKEMGHRVAMQVMYQSLIELVELNEIQTMAQILVSNVDFIDKALADLDITNNFGVIIAAIRRGDDIIIPSATEFLKCDDLIIVIGEKKKVEILTRKI